MLCSWLYQPRPHIIAPEFRLHILSGRVLESESPSGCGLELKHSAMSRAALSCCFAVWSVGGLEITNLCPVPPLGTILCPSKEGSPKAECACVRATPRLLWLTGSSGQWSFQDLISQWIYNLPSLLMPRRHFFVLCGWAGRSHAKNHSLCLSLKIKEDLYSAHVNRSSSKGACSPSRGISPRHGKESKAGTWFIDTTKQQESVRLRSCCFLDHRHCFSCGWL